jgi:hypothetical protein
MKNFVKLLEGYITFSRVLAASYSVRSARSGWSGSRRFCRITLGRALIVRRFPPTIRRARLVGEG